VKHVPQRTCVACGLEKGKRDLIRIVRTPAEGVQVDLTGKLSGRGAYLCVEQVCWTKGLSSHVLNGALKTTLTAADYAHLEDFALRLADATIPQAKAPRSRDNPSKQI
jgi:predicted RNA-binding protein YlxR (DUF448 family)